MSRLFNNCLDFVHAYGIEVLKLTNVESCENSSRFNISFSLQQRSTTILPALVNRVWFRGTGRIFIFKEGAIYISNC